MKSDHFVEWDHLKLRVRGSSLEQIVIELLRQKQLPVSDFRIECREGELVASARIRNVLSVPVKVSIDTITISGRTLQIPLKDVSTLAGFPVPRVLFRLVRSEWLPDGVRFDADRLTVTVFIERFLPAFIDLTLDSIRIVPGGLEVDLGPGGADPPQFG